LSLVGFLFVALIIFFAIDKIEREEK